MPFKNCFYFLFFFTHSYGIKTHFGTEHINELAAFYAKSGFIEPLIKLITNHSLSVNEPIDCIGFSIMMHAVRGMDPLYAPQLVKILIEDHGGDIHTLKSRDFSPLQMALYCADKPHILYALKDFITQDQLYKKVDGQTLAGTAINTPDSIYYADAKSVVVAASKLMALKNIGYDFTKDETIKKELEETKYKELQKGAYVQILQAVINNNQNIVDVINDMTQEHYKNLEADRMFISEYLKINGFESIIPVAGSATNICVITKNYLIFHPVNFHVLSEEAKKAILEHELEHVRRNHHKARKEAALLLKAKNPTISTQEIYQANKDLITQHEDEADAAAVAKYPKGFIEFCDLFGQTEELLAGTEYQLRPKRKQMAQEIIDQSKNIS